MTTGNSILEILPFKFKKLCKQNQSKKNQKKEPAHLPDVYSIMLSTYPIHFPEVSGVQVGYFT